MKYVRVDNVLPEDLIKEIQKYIQGEYIYIPSQPGTKKKWGERSRTRDYIQNRNKKICDKFVNGYSINTLSEEFFLSDSSIKKIVYGKDK